MVKLTTEEFIEKAKIIHEDKYDYSKTKYLHSLKNITITCSVHGDFEQLPSNHLQGSICKMCAIEARTNSIQEFIDKANKRHNHKYNYSKVSYINNKTNVTIICPVHGIFEQTPNTHLRGGECPECGRIKSDTNRRKTTEEFIEKSKTVHGNKYDYSITNYTTSKDEVTVICKEHGEFTKLASSHLSGQGCPECATHGFKQNSPAILYYLRVTTSKGENLYKIGITNRSVNERFNIEELSKIEVLIQEKFKIGRDAYLKEQGILEKYKDFQYKGPSVLVNGNTELFTKNVLKDIL